MPTCPNLACDRTRRVVESCGGGGGPLVVCLCVRVFFLSFSFCVFFCLSLPFFSFFCPFLSLSPHFFSSSPLHLFLGFLSIPPLTQTPPVGVDMWCVTTTCPVSSFHVQVPVPSPCPASKVASARRHSSAPLTCASRERRRIRRLVRIKRGAIKLRLSSCPLFGSNAVPVPPVT